MLTDEEIMDIRNRAKLNDNRQINPILCGDFYLALQ